MKKKETTPMTSAEAEALMLKCDQAAARFIRQGKPAQAQACMNDKAMLKVHADKARSGEKLLEEIKQNKDMRMFFIKTMVMCVTAIDLTTMYSDTLDRFLSRHNLARRESLKQESEAAMKALHTLRDYYAIFLHSANKEDEFNLFDELEAYLAKGMFTDRERAYYNEYSK